jgi:hypothetical protein
LGWRRDATGQSLPLASSFSAPCPPRHKAMDHGDRAGWAPSPGKTFCGRGVTQGAVSPTCGRECHGLCCGLGCLVSVPHAAALFRHPHASTCIYMHHVQACGRWWVSVRPLLCRPGAPTEAGRWVVFRIPLLGQGYPSRGPPHLAPCAVTSASCTLHPPPPPQGACDTVICCCFNAWAATVRVGGRHYRPLPRQAGGKIPAHGPSCAIYTPPPGSSSSSSLELNPPPSASLLSLLSSMVSDASDPSAYTQ